MVLLELQGMTELAFSLLLQIPFGCLSLKFHGLLSFDLNLFSLWNIIGAISSLSWIVTNHFFVKIETLTLVMDFAAEVIMMVTVIFLFLIYRRLIFLLKDIRILLKIYDAILLFL